MKTPAIATDIHKRAEVGDEYLNAKPWPHVVVENGFPEDFLDEIADEVATLINLTSSRASMFVKSSRRPHKVLVQPPSIFLTWWTAKASASSSQP